MAKKAPIAARAASPVGGGKTSRSSSPLKLLPSKKDTPLKRRTGTARDASIPPLHRASSPVPQEQDSDGGSQCSTPREGMVRKNSFSDSKPRRTPRLPPSSSSSMAAHSPSTPVRLTTGGDSNNNNNNKKQAAAAASSSSSSSEVKNLRKPEVDEDAVLSTPTIVRRNSFEYLETLEAWETPNLSEDKLQETKCEVETKLKTIVGNLEQFGKKQGELRRTQSLTSVMGEQKAHSPVGTNDHVLSSKGTENATTTTATTRIRRSLSFTMDPEPSTKKQLRSLGEFLSRDSLRRSGQQLHRDVSNHVFASSDDQTWQSGGEQESTVADNTVASRLPVPQPHDDGTVATTQSYNLHKRKRLVRTANNGDGGSELNKENEEEEEENTPTSASHAGGAAIAEETTENKAQTQQQSADREDDVVVQPIAADKILSETTPRHGVESGDAEESSDVESEQRKGEDSGEMGQGQIKAKDPLAKEVRVAS